MLKIMKNIFKAVVFITLLVMILNYIGHRLIPTWYDEWINTQVVKDFYALPKNSVDIITVGSSQIIKGFSSLELYKNYGISAYGIGTEQQSIQNSYAWIKESLRTQDEKVVFFEVKMLFEDTPDAQNRKGLDNMKFSLNKMECILEDYKESKSFENMLGYLFPIARFHSRWNEEKVDEALVPKFPNYRGYSLKNALGGDLTYTPLEMEKTEKKEMTSGREKTFGKMANYCKKKNITLVLFKIQDLDWDIERYNKVKELADKYQLEYIDFNTPELVKELEFDYAKESEANNHLNIYGAEKVSNYLGKYISEKFEFEDRRGTEGFEQVDEQLKNYNYDVENKKIVNIFNAGLYIDAIKSEDITIVALKNNIAFDESSNFTELMQNLNFDETKVKSNKNYCVIKQGNEVILEESNNDEVQVDTTLDGQPLKIYSNGAGVVSIIFNGVEYSNYHTGFVLLVYNHKTRTVVESSFIDYANGITSVGR